MRTDPLRCNFGCLLFLVSLLVAGCDKPPYEVIDTGYIASDDIYWLDNDRVIFIGKLDSHQETPRSILIWDWDNGLEIYRESSQSLSKLCYFDGKIRYSFKASHEDEWREWMVGPLGEEQAVKIKRKPDYQRQFSRIDCHFVKEPEFLAGRRWIPLAEGHGYLERGPLYGPSEEQLHANFRLYSDRIPHVKTLPPTNDTANHVRYYQFKSAYFIWGASATTWKEWKDAGCTRGWWLRLDGEVDEVCIPFVYLGEQTKPYIYPTKDGYVLAGGSPGTKSGKNTQGVYYLSGEKLTKLVSGSPGKPAVSPNGCRVAFPTMPRPKRPGDKRSLKLVDLCNSTQEE